VDWSERIGRRIKLRDLHILLAIAQAGSIAKAASELAISQPAVSKVIADLEHALGVRLLDRDRHGAAPTIYGAALLKHGTVAFDEIKQGVKEIEFLVDPTAGELRIGSSGAMTDGLLPVILNRLRRHHPRLTFEVTQAHTGASLYRELRERNVDLIVGRMTLPIEDDDLNADGLFDDPQFVVAGSRNRWLRRRDIELAELMDEPWIFPPTGTVTRTVIAETFAACGLPVPRADVVSSSLPLHSAMLADGRLLAIWPASILRFGAKNFAVKVLPVKLPALPRPIGIITLKRRMISPVAALFIDCAREVTKPLAEAVQLPSRKGWTMAKV
jgi:DNA-binding transcriptional LysR family regulator